MDSIVPSDIPYVIAFVVVAILFFWLMGHLGQRGLPDGHWRVLPPALLCLYFLFGTVSDLAHREWIGAAFGTLMSVVGALAVWSAWRRVRLTRPRA